MHVPLSFEDAWIKAAVEHRVLNVSYRNPEVGLGYTKRDILPDYLEDAPAVAARALLRHAPQLGYKMFNPAYFTACYVTEERFEPPSDGRWRELVPIYEERGLDQKTF